MRKLHPVLQRMLNEYRRKHANTTISQQQILNEVQCYKAMELTDKLYEDGLISYSEYVSLYELNKQSFKPLFQELYREPLRIKKRK